ncbi:MAG: HEPN domain-containing protein [Chloroflexi bacterium]|nr:HEPN domain-containing protein [Chloroflexota bacterium]
MPHDPALVQDTRAWLTRAQRDLQVAEHDMNAAPPFLDAVVFHCQQAAEKALKALLAWHDVPFRKTHDLAKIGEACVKIDATLQEVIDRASPLTEYAWKYRYPGERAEPPRAEAEEALALAREVYAAILARLPGEAAP